VFGRDAAGQSFLLHNVHMSTPRYATQFDPTLSALLG
jgi:hypothetical protein